jgi:tetratricopeptide (TPR) repeat protein
MLILVFALGGLAAFLILSGRDPGFGWVLAVLALSYPMLVVGALPHEAGHVVAARLSGFEIFQVELGVGRRVRTMEICGVRVMIHLVPWGGLTSAGSEDARLIRLRRALLYLGGPATNLALAGAYVWLVAPRSFGPSPSLAGALGASFLLSNLFIGVVNLIPRHIQSQAGRIPNDGMGILSSIFARSASKATWREGYYAGGWRSSNLRNDKAEARDWCEKGVAAMPDSLALQLLLGVSLTDLGEAARARAIFEALLAREPLEPRMRLILENNVAYCDFLLEERIEEADRYSQEAIQAIPWQPHFQVTRAAVLLLKGEPEEAITLLGASHGAFTDDDKRAGLACLLAMAHGMAGNADEARRQLDRARSIDPENPLLARASRQLAGAW